MVCAFVCREGERGRKRDTVLMERLQVDQQDHF